MNVAEHKKFIENKEKQARILLIRHGMTQGNKEHRYVGTTDEGLLPESVEQLRGMREFWQKQVSMKDAVGNLTVYVSPYLRAKQTADILFPGAKQVEIAEFAECRFGDFEYKNYAELNGNPDYQRFIDSGGTTVFPGGESRAEFTERVMQGFEKLLADVEESQPYTIVVVAHGGTIMALMDQLSEPHKDYFDWQVKPGEGVAGILSVNEDRNVVITNITRQ